VALGAVVGCPRFGLIRGQIVDMSMGGLYIRAETSIVPIGADVTVTFQPGCAVQGDCLSLNGRVAHQSLHGFGIEFDVDRLDIRCRDALERLLPMMPRVSSKAFPILRAG
jgi:hypothetical protein